MDMSKAFDMVDWSELFSTLLERKVDPVFLRLLLFIYQHQQCDVKWCGKFSQRFPVSNGVRQGGVSSGIFFAVYIDKLLGILRSSKFGCHIDNVFLGAMVFADDIFLLSASRSGLQEMVNICHEFAAARNLKFGTNPDPKKAKTKCIIFSKKRKNSQLPANIVLNGVILPWVSQVKHLGHTLQADNSMKVDMAMKRGAFIGKVNSLLQEFHAVPSEVLIKILNIYATSLYGSNTWDLLSSECDRLYKSFNVAIRKVLDVDRCTHRYMIEPLSGSQHLKVMLESRYATFYKTLVTSKKTTIRFMSRLAASDKRTVMGRTLAWLADSCGLDDINHLSASIVKKKSFYRMVPEEDVWRLDIGHELLMLRDGSHLDLPGFSHMEKKEMLEFVCIS